MKTKLGNSVKNILPGEVCPYGKGDACCGNYQRQTENTPENMEKKTCPHFQKIVRPVEGIKDIPDTLWEKPVPAFLQTTP